MKVGITDAAKAVLVRGTVAGNLFTLPPGQLDRKLYEEVNKVLAAGGGKWNRKLGGHEFPSEERLADLQKQWMNGDEVVHVKKATQAFYTPDALADELVMFAGITSGMHVLEPSAGQGAIVKHLVKHGARVTAVEVDPVSCKVLRREFPDIGVVEKDFMEFDNAKLAVVQDPVWFDAVVMNPPFTGGQDIKHVTRAFEMLRPGGILVSVMSPGWLQSERQAHLEFKSMLKSHGGEVRQVPEGAFAESGTNIRTVMVRLVA